jgi:Mg2+-importing ATPase
MSDSAVGPLQESFWTVGNEAALVALATGPRGLAADEAARRLERHGPNTVVDWTRPSVLVELLRRFRNPLLLLLLGASGVAAATGDRRSLVVILAMVVLSILLDFIQERRAGRAADHLRDATVVRATVVRSGQERSVPTPEVVPGDIAVLSAGDLVPGDGLLLEGRDLFVNQAALTGEAFPVEKLVHAASPGQGAAEAPGALLMGSSVVSGCGRMVVVRTGRATTLGQVGVSLAHRPPPTAFEIGTRAFGLMILRLTILLVLLVLLINGLRGRPWIESFLFAMALAVGLTPEMLPMVVSVTLSRGAIQLSRKKVLVKRLAAIHDLGSMDVLCTDKTGTLTEARITLEKHIDPQGAESARVLELAYLNSHFESGLKSPLDEAILAHDEVSTAGWEKLDEVPFDFERRRVSVLVRQGTLAPILVVKGACEDILQHSAYFERDGGPLPLDDQTRGLLGERLDELAREGFRVLGIAWRTASGQAPTAADESGLIFAGFAAFFDPPRAGAREALAALADLGVAVKVVTGDSELVAQHVCRQIDLPEGGLLTGAQLQAMDDAALEAVVDHTSLFCRVSPAQKNRVILALKRRGRTVGYLGDGINDAPPLHSSDVGISVEGAVDVAREAADLIMLERSLSVLHDAVVEGRRTLGNIIKYILMGTSSNFGNMFSMAGAAAFLPFLPMLPIQVLVNNFIYDLSEIPIPLDEVDPEYVRRPHRWNMGFIRRFMLVIGPVSSLFDFTTFYILLRLFGPNESLFHSGWFVESLATQILVIFVIRTRGNPLRSRPSRVLLATAAALVLLAGSLPFTAVGRALGLVALPGRFFLALLVLVPLYLLAVEGVKRLFYSRAARR